MSPHFFRLVLLCCLANCFTLYSFAQSGLLKESELDTAKVWFNAPAPKPPLPEYYSNHNRFETFSELADHIKAGKRVVSVVVNGIANDWENLEKCRDIQMLRIMIPEGREGYLDSVFTHLKHLPVQHLDISFAIPQSGPKELKANTHRLPESIKQLRFLKKITLNAGSFDWPQASAVLAAIPTLKTLFINRFYAFNKPEPVTIQITGLGKLRQLDKLTIQLFDQLQLASDLAELEQLRILEIQDSGSKSDAASEQLAETIARLVNLESLVAPMRVLNKGAAVANLKHLKVLNINGYFTRDKLAIDSPVNLSKLEELEELTIEGTSMNSWPEGICSLKKIRSVSLRSNKLTGTPDCLGNLKNLEILSLTDNPIKKTLASIGGLSKLRVLNLSACQLDTIPDVFGTLPALQYLYLDQNQLTALPGSIGRIGGLVMLNIHSNQIRQLPPLDQPAKLEHLDVSGNKLTDIPASISKAVSLTSLLLTGNAITQLPETLADCKNLKTLSVSSNKLTQLPTRTGKLRRLRRLYAESNSLTVLPESISQLDSLEGLNIAQNRLTKLPVSVSRWKSITDLRLNQNPIQELPEDIGALTRLISLHLQESPIQALPPSFLNLTELRYLSLTKTKIRFLPEEIGKLKKLQMLMLVDNELMALPDQLGQCSELSMITLIGNRIVALPNSIGRLKKLNMLTITGQNKESALLESLPDSIVHCTGLEQVRLVDLPMLNAGNSFKNLISLPKLRTLTMTGTQLSELPDVDWTHVQLQQLNLSNNALSSVPTAMLKAPNLQLIGLRDNPLPKQLDGSFSSKDQLQIAFVEMGQIKLDASGKKDWSLANGFMQSGMRKAGQRDWTGAEEDLAKAIALAPDSVIAVIHAQRAEFFLFRKQFSESVNELDKALTTLPQLTENNRTFVMSGVRAPQKERLKALWLSRKAMVLGRTGQFEAARSVAEQAVNELSPLEKLKPEEALTAGMIYTELGRFQLLTNQPSKAITTFTDAVTAYEKSYFLEAGTRLTMVELSLITARYDKAAKFLRDIPDYQRGGGYDLLHEYLQQVTAVLADKQSPAKAEEALSLFLKSKGGRITGWSYDLFDTWLSGADLPAEKPEALKRLTAMVKERSMIEK